MSNPNTVKIFVNTIEQFVPKGKISYEAVVSIAYPNPDYDGNTYKVTYFRKNDNHEGVLAKGGSVEVVDEMSFTVLRTIRS